MFFFCAAQVRANSPNKRPEGINHTKVDILRRFRSKRQKVGLGGVSFWGNEHIATACIYWGLAFVVGVCLCVQLMTRARQIPGYQITQDSCAMS